MESSGFGVERDEEMMDTGSDQNAIHLKGEGEGDANTRKTDAMTEKPCDVDEGKEDLMGLVVHSENEAFKLYTEYGHRMGFSVRRGKQTYFTKTDKIRTKDYYCSKEGFKLDERPNESSYTRVETRTGCKAMVRFKVDKDGQWKVVRCIPDHNHDLAKPEERHLLRSARSMSNAKVGALISMVNAGFSGIPTTNIYSYMAEVSDAENVGFCYNYISVQKRASVEAGDLQSLVNHFKHRARDECMFYWDAQVDQEGRLTNFFWRDGRSRIDYDSFGDVVVFDSTNRTNKYNIICAPFVGVNNHWQNVMFGCAILVDDSTDSYVWLFKTFLESMGNQPPKTILTDQDQALANAIEQVFPTTFHRLCLCHISRNAPSHIESLKSNKKFMDLFNKCLKGCDTEIEFEEMWGTMILKYNCEGHKWLSNLYMSRHMWCTALNNSIFHAGINSPQRSESTNYTLSGLADKKTPLTHLILVLEKLVKSWRHNEAEEDFRCNHAAPELVIKHSDMLKHAANIYTHKIYKLFENEFLDGCGATFSQEIPLGDNLYRFQLMMQGQGSKVSVVHVDTSTTEVYCTCKKFESEGILCSHALKALSQKNVNKIPEKYIIKRWTKDARKRVHKVKEDGSSQQSAEFCYRGRALRYAYDLITRSQGSKMARIFVLDALEGAEATLETYLGSLSKNANSVVRDDAGNDIESETNEKDDAFPLFDRTYVSPKGLSSEGHFGKGTDRSSQGETDSYD